MCVDLHSWLATREKRAFAQSVVLDPHAQSAQANPRRHFTTPLDFVLK